MITFGFALTTLNSKLFQCTRWFFPLSLLRNLFDHHRAFLFLNWNGWHWGTDSIKLSIWYQWLRNLISLWLWMREISFWQFSNKSEILFGLELHTIHMLWTKKLMNFANNDCDQQKFARSWELQCMKTAFIDSCAYKLSLWMLGGTGEGNSHLEQM